MFRTIEINGIEIIARTVETITTLGAKRLFLFWNRDGIEHINKCAMLEKFGYNSDSWIGIEQYNDVAHIFDYKYCYIFEPDKQENIDNINNNAINDCKVYLEMGCCRKGFVVCIETSNTEMSSADIQEMVARINKDFNNPVLVFWYDSKKRFEIKRVGDLFFPKEEAAHLVEHLSKKLNNLS